ncbi:MAG: hypothetical protein KKB70_07680 [Proteobacteria bacterium]|nr:hypothetical protein [Pseudomonadota bacterium]MBU1612186.1 hypothetical protein [Pseudomonadota bacterium]
MSKLMLKNALPDFSEELEAALKAQGEHSLAAQISGMVLVDRCRCGDSFCSMFYVVNPPKGSWGPEHENIEVEMNVPGMVILDIVKGRIMAIEVLDRDDVHEKLFRVMP